MKKAVLASLALSLALPATAQAAVIVTTVGATNPYTGPTPTYDFETPAPVVGGTIANSTIPGVHTRPFGSTGNYLSVGTLDSTPAVLTLPGAGALGAVSFLWGSMDAHNLFELLDSSGNVLFSIGGQAVKVLTAPQPQNVNRVVTFTFTDAATQSSVALARFSSAGNSFEIDNFAVRAVPEPATWLMMILGFFGLSFALRRRTANSVRVRYA